MGFDSPSSTTSALDSAGSSLFGSSAKAWRAQVASNPTNTVTRAFIGKSSAAGAHRSMIIAGTRFRVVPPVPADARFVPARTC
jgi:hypothetical protein